MTMYVYLDFVYCTIRRGLRDPMNGSGKPQDSGQGYSPSSNTARKPPNPGSVYTSQLQTHGREKVSKRRGGKQDRWCGHVTNHWVTSLWSEDTNLSHHEGTKCSIFTLYSINQLKNVSANHQQSAEVKTMSTTGSTLQHAFLHRQKTDAAHAQKVCIFVSFKTNRRRVKWKYVFIIQHPHLHSPFFFEWVTQNRRWLECPMNLHSRMDLDGSRGLWDRVWADLHGVVTVRWHPAQPIYLCKQVNSRYAIVLRNAK